ncbi:Single-strand binding protein [Elusimicrobium minutum Pei191]|uniref:Single-stranded DNA-binding protein n=1 Tax=Elusimicrobium minutum (strain Pei191) TaxID=445932 RepID=B2KEG1_ELUMP|nr:single-stranded DNA-binding protein [Elusimicrobium minutum]ACC98907.1 Single-strand binding protein [Elusimicrobium minutum Pei191]
MASQIRLPEQNLVLLTGRLTRDANTAFTQKGAAVSRFDIAVNRRYMDANGSWQDETTFVPVTLWGPAAERSKDRLKKGVPVHVEGRLVLNEYTDKNGVAHKNLQVNCRRIQILQSAFSESASGSGASFNDTPVDNEAIDDDVPF